MLIITMKPEATSQQIHHLQDTLLPQSHSIQWHGTRLLLASSDAPQASQELSNAPGVEQVRQVETPYPLASRRWQPDDTQVSIGSSYIGGQPLSVIAGPCSVESRDQILETAQAVKEAGAIALRGGAFKPRSSPYSFQGHQKRALRWLAEAREATGLPIVTEVLDGDLLPLVCEYADILQIGSRNMQNFALLRQVARCNRPVLLKRGMQSTLQEYLLAAEYILQGNPNVILCERGIRTFTRETRNTFDANAIPWLKDKTHLPVLADPSHAVGNSDYVGAIARCGLAAGADGLLIEVHPSPKNALSDGAQSLTFEQFQQTMDEARRIAEAMNRPFPRRNS